jgi:hypothetical protein
MHIATALKTTKVCTTATFRGFRAFPPLIRKELFFRSSENQRQIPEDGLINFMAQKFHGANARLTLMKSIIWRSSWFFERRFDEDHSSLNTVSYDAF